VGEWGAGKKKTQKVVHTSGDSKQKQHQDKTKKRKASVLWGKSDLRSKDKRLNPQKAGGGGEKKTECFRAF